jgi:plastocyanin
LKPAPEHVPAASGNERRSVVTHRGLNYVVLSLGISGLLAVVGGCRGTAGQGGGRRGAQSAPDKSAPQTNQILIDNFTFNPATLTVTAGATVTWVNRDDVPHTATSSAKPRVFDSGALDTDERFSHVFDTPGTYAYFCAIHPHMTGKIIVK